MKIGADSVYRLLALLLGSSLQKLGATIAAFGLSVLTSIFQYIIGAVFEKLGIDIRIPETPAWVGWALLFIGIFVAVYGSRQHYASQRPASANPHDVENLAELRALVLHEILFFRQHDFGSAFERRRTDKFDEFVATWMGANRDFVNNDVQKKLVNMRQCASTLAKEIAERTFVLDNNTSFSTVNPGPDAKDAENRALASAKLINSAAHSYVNSVDDFEQTAKVQIV